MSKIKGWKKEGHDFWMTNAEDNAIYIHPENFVGPNNKWIVYVDSKSNGDKEPIPIASFDTKEEAKKFVMDYMKNHHICSFCGSINTEEQTGPVNPDGRKNFCLNCGTRF